MSPKRYDPKKVQAAAQAVEQELKLLQYRYVPEPERHLSSCECESCRALSYLLNGEGEGGGEGGK